MGEQTGNVEGQLTEPNGTGEGGTEVNEPNGNQPIDYEAKYNELLKHSRDWERKAKANKDAAEELKKLKDAQLSDAERMQKELDEYKAQAAALQAEKERAEWVKSVSESSGVDQSILALVSAADQGDLEEKAAIIAKAMGDGEQKTIPVVLGDGTHANQVPASTPEADFAEMMKNFR